MASVRKKVIRRAFVPAQASSVQKGVTLGKRNAALAPSVDVPARPEKASCRSLADSLAGQREIPAVESPTISKEQVDSLAEKQKDTVVEVNLQAARYEATAPIEPIPLSNEDAGNDEIYRAVSVLIEEIDRKIEREDVEWAMSRSLHLALENFVTLERATHSSNKKFVTLKAQLRESESALSSAREEVHAQTLRANSREEELNGLKAKIAKQENEMSQLRADMRATAEELLALKKAHASDLEAKCEQAREEIEARYVCEMPKLINKEVYQAHCRSLTLVGVERGDPRWVNCQFPYKGARPAEWESMMASLDGFATTMAAIPSGSFVQQSSEGENHKIGDSRDTSLKTSARKNMTDNVKEKKEKATTLKKLSSEDKIGKEVMKGKDKPEKEILQPSDSELRETVCRILPEVDINTATFADFREKLAGMYNLDLTHRKHSIQLMIRDELTKLAEEADDGDEDEDEEEENEDCKAEKKEICRSLKASKPKV